MVLVYDTNKCMYVCFILAINLLFLIVLTFVLPGRSGLL